MAARRPCEVDMKLVKDDDLCEANRVCMKLAPEVYSVDDKDVMHILVERPEGALAGKAQTAARLCPRGAIKIVDE